MSDPHLVIKMRLNWLGFVVEKRYGIASGRIGKNTMGYWDTALIKLVEKFIRCDENSKPKSEYYKQVKSKLNTHK